MQVIFYLFLWRSRLLLPSTMILSILLTGASKVFPYTCPNNLNLFSRIFSKIGATLNFSLNSWFQISFIIMLSHIHLSIRISATFILCSKVFFTGQHSVPYIKANLIATPYNLPFNLLENFQSHSNLVVAHHLNQPACIWLEPTRLYLMRNISIIFLITLNINPKYLNFFVLVTTSSPMVTSGSPIRDAILKSHHKYFAFIYDLCATLYLPLISSNLWLTSSLVFATNMISSTNNIHYGTISHINLEISFIMTVKMKGLSTDSWYRPTLSRKDFVISAGVWMLVDTLSFISHIVSMYFVKYL